MAVSSLSALPGAVLPPVSAVTTGPGQEASPTALHIHISIQLPCKLEQ